jgi:hypothetical protein
MLCLENCEYLACFLSSIRPRFCVLLGCRMVLSSSISSALAAVSSSSGRPIELRADGVLDGLADACSSLGSSATSSSAEPVELSINFDTAVCSLINAFFEAASEIDRLDDALTQRLATRRSFSAAAPFGMYSLPNIEMKSFFSSSVGLLENQM